MKHLFTRLLLAGLASASLVIAAETTHTAPVSRNSEALGMPWSQYSANFVLDLDVGNGFVPPSIGQRARVYKGDRLVLQLSVNVSSQVAKWAQAGAKLQWTKNGVPIEGATDTSYIVESVDHSTAGSYTFSGAPFPFFVPPVILDVGEPANLNNISSRFELTGSTPQIMGFNVEGTGSKNFLVRAVGPSLKAYGVSKPAAQPLLRFFDSKGKEIVFAHTAMVIDWAPIFNSVGAFPLSGGEREYNAYTTVAFAPGAYSIQVIDESGQGGTVLLEMYELP